MSACDVVRDSDANFFYGDDNDDLAWFDVLLVCVMIGTSRSSGVTATRQRYYYCNVYSTLASKNTNNNKQKYKHALFALNNQFLELTFLSQAFLFLTQSIYLLLLLLLLLFLYISYNNIKEVRLNDTRDITSGTPEHRRTYDGDTKAQLAETTRATRTSS